MADSDGGENQEISDSDADSSERQNDESTKAGPSSQIYKPTGSSDIRRRGQGLAGYLGKLSQQAGVGISTDPGKLDMGAAINIAVRMKKRKNKTAQQEMEIKHKRELAEQQEIIQKLGLSWTAVVTLKLCIRRWRARMHASFNSPEAYAKTREDLEFIKKHTKDFATELPVPLQNAIFFEVFPCIQHTVKEYKWTMGKNYNLTMQAQKRLEELTAEAHERATM
ncbi:uncharacterized protein LOC106160329 isoform X2 [Lingula anatina]|uniref:Uncharacterized protein LOC106160329 isoform X2 n=1 Tax=Lingula anatina TaxID=7574 RepID=A0A1S3I275_LINAN|nr:uncharacterized protein LOC106160329 isoform X2 [Lingula anatina]|eukprot:XP_013392348.1 uncharacterized protein LOC106160329 isoform X2 [Lingula anatina]